MPTLKCPLTHICMVVATMAKLGEEHVYMACHVNPALACSTWCSRTRTPRLPFGCGLLITQSQLVVHQMTRQRPQPTTTGFVWTA